jgi:hypothetical protein
MITISCSTLASLIGVLINIREFDITFKGKTYNNATMLTMATKLAQDSKSLTAEEITDIVCMLRCYYNEASDLKNDTARAIIKTIKDFKDVDTRACAYLRRSLTFLGDLTRKDMVHPITFAII